MYMWCWKKRLRRVSQSRQRKYGHWSSLRNHRMHYGFSAQPMQIGWNTPKNRSWRTFATPALCEERITHTVLPWRDRRQRRLVRSCVGESPSGRKRSLPRKPWNTATATEQEVDREIWNKLCVRGKQARPWIGASLLQMAV